VNRAFRAGWTVPSDAVTPTIRRALAIENATAPLDALRSAFLDEIARVAPDVLRDLATVDRGDDEQLEAWSEQYRLTAPWLLIAAKHTLDLWHAWPKGLGRVWDHNFEDRGVLLASRGRLQARGAELLVRTDHLEWLVRARVLRKPYDTITPDAPQTSSRAVRRLARVLEIDK